MSSRTSRYFGLFKSPSHMAESLATPIVVVGCGAIGRRLLLLLAQTGFTNLTFFDDDKVSEENMGPQGYVPGQLGLAKVEAMAEDLVEILGIEDPNGEDQPFDYEDRKLEDADIQALSTNTIVFNCTDSMECRAQLSRLCQDAEVLLIDGRMAISTFQVLWQVPLAHNPEFERSLFPSSEAEQTPCTLKASSWCASTCASLMLGLLMNYIVNDGVLPAHFIKGDLMPFPSVAEVPNLH